MGSQSRNTNEIATLGNLWGGAEHIEYLLGNVMELALLSSEQRHNNRPELTTFEDQGLLSSESFYGGNALYKEAPAQFWSNAR